MSLILEMTFQLGLLALCVLFLPFLDQTITDVFKRHKARLVGGLVAGIVASLAMLSPIEVTETIRTDIRAAPIIFAAFFMGWRGALVAVFLAALVRYTQVGGALAVSGAISLALYGVHGLIAAAIYRKIAQTPKAFGYALVGAMSAVTVMPAFFIAVPPDLSLELVQRLTPVVLVMNTAASLLLFTGLSLLDVRIGTRKRLERMMRAFRKSSLLHRSVLNTLNEAVLVCDACGLILRVNPAARRLMRGDKERLRGTYLQSYFSSEQSSKRLGYWLSAMEDGKPYIFPEKKMSASGALIGANDQALLVIVNWSALQNTRSSEVVVSIVDMSELQGMREELLQALSLPDAANVSAPSNSNLV